MNPDFIREVRAYGIGSALFEAAVCLGAGVVWTVFFGAVIVPLMGG